MQILNMATIRSLILDALEKKYESDISKADATIKVYLENPVGIGEHPQIVDEVDKQISSICKAKEKLEELKNFKD
jgi:predicted sugar kinase|tara:strand:+ start:911 stop:1135 length:225 start_codon:yes stop_codon:yes gene_type:complete